METLATAQKKYQTYVEPLSLPDNDRPSDEEVAYHNITHLPYKSWCPVCVACEGKEKPVETGKEQSSTPTTAMDYCFTATSLSEEPTAICLVAIDSWSSMIQATPVASKGRALTDNMAKTVARKTSFLQCPSISLRGDNENSMTALKNSIRKKPSQMGYTTNLRENVARISENNGWRKELYRQSGGKQSHVCKHSKLNVV